MESEVKIADVLSQTQDGVFILDANCRYILFNTACERLTGCRSSEVLGAVCNEVRVAECRDEEGRLLEGSLCPGWAVFQGDVSHARQRTLIRTRDGQQRWLETHYTALLGPGNRPEVLIGVMRDISEAKVSEEDLAASTSRLRGELESLKQRVCEDYGFIGIVSRSDAMRPVFERIAAASECSSPVLIFGENGTGKETIARIIHDSGPTKEQSFVSVTCIGVSRDFIEGEVFGSSRRLANSPLAERIGAYAMAKGGTLFIDDVSALPSATQARLLRAMQERKYTAGDGSEQDVSDVRIIAGSTRPTRDLISAGRLREDLYYRLSVITIELPALRSRKEDIPLFVDQIISDFRRAGGRDVTEVEPGVWEALEGHRWPGNLRELQNVVEGALATGSGRVLRAEDVRAALRRRDRSGSSEIADPVELDGVLADVERRTILDALRRARGHRSRAAQIMGISRSRLYRRMEVLGIVPSEQW